MYWEPSQAQYACNKIVFKRRDMSQHDLVSTQTSNICITCHAALNAIACMCQTICDVTSSNVLGRLVQCEQKGWDRGRWAGIIYTPKGFNKNSMAVHGSSCKNPSVGSLYNGPGKQTSHFTGLPCSVQVQFIIISWSWLALPKQIDHKCAQNNWVQSYMQPGAGKPIRIGFSHKLNV